MSFSQVAGTSIVPTLARLVVGLSFVIIGWCRMTEQVEYPGAAAMRLRALGVTVAEAPKVAEDGESTGGEGDAGSEGAGGSGGAGANTAEPEAPGEPISRVALASLIQVQQADPQTQPPPEGEGEGDSKPAATPPATTPPAETTPPPAESTPPAQAAAEPDPNMTYTAARMYRITLGLDKRQVRPDFARLLAPAVALTEMIGGGLLLIGLFSRVWAFALVCAMAAAFYFSSLPFIFNVDNPLRLALEDNMDQFNRLARHLGFLVLALLVMLAGPGPVSLDRLLFRREPEEPEPIDID